jgi:hypothetical protein
VFTDLLRQKGLSEVVAFIEKAGGLTRPGDGTATPARTGDL